ncbi:MAG: hypothetical protein ACOYLB_13880 [Phototrophicaceae bacterium]
MSFVKNPTLVWSGNSQFITFGEQTRTVEDPTEWEMYVEQITLPYRANPVPYIYHRNDGIEINGSFVVFNVRFSQRVNLPAGQHYALLIYENHVVNAGMYNTEFVFELETGQQTYKVDEVWIHGEKGLYHLAVPIYTNQPLTNVRFTFGYRCKFATSNGKIILKHLDIQNRTFDWFELWGRGIVIEQPTPPAQPTLPDEDEQDVPILDEDEMDELFGDDEPQPTPEPTPTPPPTETGDWASKADLLAVVDELISLKESELNGLRALKIKLTNRLG